MNLIYKRGSWLKSLAIVLAISPFLLTSDAIAQQFQGSKNPVIEGIVKEANDNSQLETLAYELMDRIGPRLVGTPEMQRAHDWAIEKYSAWGIPAYNQKWGEWRGWERGITHIDMIHPRLHSIEGTQLAWSPSTKGAGVTAEVTIIPDIKDEASFKSWLTTIKGKLVMTSMPEATGRPDYNWEEFATPESFEKMKAERQEQQKAWGQRIRNTGFNSRTIIAELEKAGAAGIVTSYWSRGFGVNKIFGATTDKIPTVDISLEDYGLLARMIQHGEKPQLRIVAESKEHGEMPTFNTLAEIKGTEKPEEYVILSAHFDSWDGGTGATDNGTGTITMMEAMRILKKVYPNPKRTILVGHWGSEEQGLNGSRAFVADNPDIVAKTQAVFNQDNGTGRVVDISGQGFVNSYEYINRWLLPVPNDIKKHIKSNFPGSPAGGGSDYASFVAAGVPAFSLSSLSWSYGPYTWHTNRDTYDKIVFDDVRSNAILTAILAYMASEDPENASREKMILPFSPRTGKQMEWPAAREPNRRGGLDK